MKKLFASSLGIFSLLFILVSCGTISGSTSRVALVDAPSGMQVYANGVPVDIKWEETVSTMKIGSGGDTRTSYSSPVVKLSKKDKVTLKLVSGSNSEELQLKRKGHSGYFWGNLFFTGLTGFIVDGVTGNGKTQHPNYIDVPALLAGKPVAEWRSKAQLKKAIKNSAN